MPALLASICMSSGLKILITFMVLCWTHSIMSTYWAQHSRHVQEARPGVLSGSGLPSARERWSNWRHQQRAMEMIKRLELFWRGWESWVCSAQGREGLGRSYQYVNTWWGSKQGARLSAVVTTVRKSVEVPVNGRQSPAMPTTLCHLQMTSGVWQQEVEMKPPIYNQDSLKKRVIEGIGNWFLLDIISRKLCDLYFLYIQLRVQILFDFVTCLFSFYVALFLTGWLNLSQQKMLVYHNKFILVRANYTCQ